jgi:hypothetical protein
MSHVGFVNRSLAAAALVFLALNPAHAQFIQQGSKLVGSGILGLAGQGGSVAISADGTTAIVGGSQDMSQRGAAWVFTQTNGVWTQQGSKLVGTDAIGNAAQGTSVALSSDGNTAIVGGPFDNSGVGAAWVFTRSGGAWTQEGTKLVGIGAVGGARQGWSVSLSADGNMAIAGGPNDNSNAGAIWVFTRSGGEWNQSWGKLVGTGAVGSAYQGWSISLSGDGKTAIVGGYGDNSGAGALWVFSRSSGGVWSQQGSKLVGTGVAGFAEQGWSVSVSSDGNTAIAGGRADSSGAGAAWVFVRTGAVWSQSGSKLVGTGATSGAEQGRSVSLASDGNTAVVGGYHDQTGWGGATWVFIRSGGVWRQEGAKLVGAGAVGSSLQGSSVSLSGDGNSVIVSGSGDEYGAGASWVFTRSGGVWSQVGSKLVGTGATGATNQGSSVSLSSDGNTALVGGPADHASAGATWVYTRAGGVWNQQGEKLVGSGAAGNANQGSSVSLSSDGNTALVGGPNDSLYAGAAWVFRRTGGMWSQQGAKLVGTGAAGSPYQGESVALSSDGNTAILGGSADNNHVGAAWVFTRVAGVWTQQGLKLVGSGAVGAAWQGISVSLSSDGNTAIIGGNSDNSLAGAAWVFTRSGGVWTQQGTKLVGSGAVGTAYQGGSVSLSPDGNTAIVGGYGDSGGLGAIWVFTRAGGVWAQQGSKLVGTGAVGSAYEGTSVSLSSNGNTAIVGGFEDNSSAGAAWVFTRTGGVWSQLGPKLVGTGAVGNACQGMSVAISGDGSTAFVGGYVDDYPIGAAWAFSKPTNAIRVSGFKASTVFTLAQNFPNPFNPSTTITIELPRETKVNLGVYNTLGQKVAQLVDGIMPAGSHSVVFDASGLASGVYVYMMKAGDYFSTKKMTVVR